MIWTRVAYAGIEIISIPAYAHVATRVQIILYALPVATLAQAYIVNRPLVMCIYAILLTIHNIQVTRIKQVRYADDPIKNCYQQPNPACGTFYRNSVIVMGIILMPVNPG